MAEEVEEPEKYTLEIIVYVTMDKDRLDRLDFPKDKKGILIWDPFACIKDVISHSLFKEHDASYMGTLDEIYGLEFAGWTVKFPKELIEKLTEIMVRNLWNHPEDKRGKELRDKYGSLEDAIKQVTKEAIHAFG
jgi:hypothetical protein